MNVELVSQRTDGVLGDAELATKEKGKRVYHEAVKQLGRFIDYFRNRPLDTRGRHQARKLSMPIPWSQYDSLND